MPKLKSSEINKPNNFLLDLVKDNSGTRVRISNPNNVLWCWDKYFRDDRDYSSTRQGILEAIENGKYYDTNYTLKKVGDLMIEPQKIIERLQDLITHHGSAIDLNKMAHKAIRVRDEKLFKFLLDNGVDPNHQSTINRNLMEVALMRGVTSIFNLLWEHPKTNRDVKVMDGFNMAHLAVSYKNYSVLQTIAQKSPHLFLQRDNTGKTPLNMIDAINGYEGLFNNINDKRYFIKVPQKVIKIIESTIKELFKTNNLVVSEYKNPDLKIIISKAYNDLLEKQPGLQHIHQKTNNKTRSMKI